MIAEYKINVASKTKNGADIATGFVLGVLSISKEGSNYILTIRTYKTQGATPIEDSQKDLGPHGVQVYTYAKTDNAKTENTMLKNKFESDLDAWFTNAKWTKL